MVKSRRMSPTDKTIQEMQSELERHGKTLYGNGEPGMDEILRGLNKDMRDRRERDKEQRDTILSLTRTAAGTAITAIIVLIINGLVWFIKILPILDKLK